MSFINVIFSLLLLAAIVFGLVKFKESDSYYSIQDKVEDITEGAGNFVKSRAHNIYVDFSRDRQRPLTLVDKESKLQEFLPQVFGYAPIGEFDQEAWNDFWNLIYDPVTEKNENGFMAKRYLSKEEIEQELKASYQIFNHFQRMHWDFFWEIISK